MAIDSAIDDIMVECMKSTKVLAKVMFEERFYAPFSGLHDQIFDLIDSGAPRVAIAAPRGIGKTSIVALALAAKRILFRVSKFIPYVNMSFDSACLQTENLKRELITNVMIKNLFGSVKPRKSEGIEESFSKKTWIAMDTLVLPRGSGQQIRGVLYGNSRPDLFIIDDLEDPETIQNDDVRRKRKEWFNADLMKAVSRIDKGWQIIYIDTLKHEDSLLEDLLASKDWESVRLEICDDNLKSNAPSFISDEEVLREHNYHKEQGLLDVFYREFRNIPISTEDAVFKPEHFKYYDEDGDRLRVYVEGQKEPELIYANRLFNVVLVDPAKTVKLQSADSAIGLISVDRETHRIFVREIVSGKFYPDELYDHMFRLVREYNARVLGVEVTSLHQFISQPIENEMRVRQLYPQYLELKAVNKKEERVATLAPLYKLGYIYHNRVGCTKLEAQLLGFPRSKYWDVMDMLAYITKVMDELAYYFDPPDHEEEDPEELYDDLDNDDVLEWARAI